VTGTPSSETRSWLPGSVRAFSPRTCSRGSCCMLLPLTCNLSGESSVFNHSFALVFATIHYQSPLPSDLPLSLSVAGVRFPFSCRFARSTAFFTARFLTLVCRRADALLALEHAQRHAADEALHDSITTQIELVKRLMAPQEVRPDRLLCAVCRMCAFITWDCEDCEPEVSLQIMFGSSCVWVDTCSQPAQCCSTGCFAAHRKALHPKSTASI
jgi:hypothetical protein